nr:CDP-alcohol phosphatidyltransferase family protein [Salsipaludibacter albus]
MSLIRLLVLPWLYWLVVDEQYLFGLLVGFVFASTDWFDGYVARRFDQVTKLGQLLDPISDRLFIVTVMVSLVVSGVVPWPLALAIVLRDLLLLVGGAIMLGSGGSWPGVTRLGKFATFGLMMSFPLLLVGASLTKDNATTALVGEPWGWVTIIGLIWAWVFTVLYWVVGVGYARVVLARRRAGPGGAAHERARQADDESTESTGSTGPGEDAGHARQPRDDA